ncbi:MAG: carbohydrate-binding family 9-like protein [Verrucomicrobia bacterium]|nr:carbohydrate-binding family 9-like protein [Verrucomicrobiota bacterium]
MKLKTPPALNGDPADAAWHAAPWLGGMRDIGGLDVFSVEQMVFSVGWNAETLFVRGVCLRRDPAAIRAVAQGLDDDRIFNDEAVEIFLTVEGSKTELIQIAVNSIGALWDMRRVAGKDNKAWNSGARVKAMRIKESWTFEMALPLGALELTPEIGRRFRLNLCRDISAGATGQEVSYSSWCKVSGMFGQTEAFFPFELSAEHELAPANVAEQEMRLNRAFAGEVRNRERRLHGLVGEIKRFTELPGLDQNTRADVETFSATVLAATPPPDARLLELARARMIFLNVSNHGTALQNVLSQLRLKTVLKDGVKAVREGVQQVGEIWLLGGRDIVGAVDAPSGTLMGIWDRSSQTLIVNASSLEYLLQTRADDTVAGDSGDRVLHAQPAKDSLTLTCATELLDGLRIEKRYALREGGTLAVRFHVTGPAPIDHLVHIANRTSFDPGFMRQAVYQVPMFAGVPEHTLVSPGAIKEMDTAQTQHDGQLIVFDKARRLGLAQYLYRMNDLPVATFGVQRAKLHPADWQWHPASFFLKQAPFSWEVRYHLFRGDRMRFHREYLAFPEIRAILAASKPDPRVKLIRYIGGNDQMFGASREVGIQWNRHFRDALRRHELAYTLTANHDFATHFPIGDEAVIPLDRQRKASETGKQRRQRYQDLKLFLPAALLFQYHWPWEIFPGTPEFRAHADLIATERDGSYMKGCHSLTHYGYWMTSSRACQEFVVNKLVEEMKYYGTSGAYLDGPPNRPIVDWKSNAVAGQDLAFEYNRRVFEAMRANGGLYWRNGWIDDYYSDITLFEGSTVPHMTWRQSLEAFWLKKRYQTPGQMQIVWDLIREPDRQRRTINDALAVGLSFFTPVEEQYFTLPKGGYDLERQARPFRAYHTLAYEMREASLADIDYTPCWFRDDTTDSCINALVKPRTALLTMLRHANEAGPIEAALKVSDIQLGNTPWFIVKHVGRSMFISRARPYNRLPLNWQSAFDAVTVETVSHARGERLPIKLDQVDPDVLNVVAITDVPALLASIEGEPVQLRIPDQPGVTLRGTAQPARKRTEIDVNSIAEAEILAWFPAQWGTPHIFLEQRESLADGRELLSRASRLSESAPVVTLGTERFLLIPVHAGRTRLIVSSAPIPLPTRGAAPVYEAVLATAEGAAGDDNLLQNVFGRHLAGRATETKLAKVKIVAQLAKTPSTGGQQVKITLQVSQPQLITDLNLKKDDYHLVGHFKVERIEPGKATALLVDKTANIVVTGGQRFTDANGKEAKVDNHETARSCGFYCLAEQTLDVLSEVEDEDHDQ